MYWDDLLIVGLLMAYFDVRMARRKRLASLAATKKATPSRAAPHVNVRARDEDDADDDGGAGGLPVSE